VKTVFVSSTYLDLKAYRAEASNVLRRMGHVDIAMEYYGAEDARPIDRCLEDVARCDAYVGIFAWRYGWAPPTSAGPSKSITELEYETAVQNNKPRLLFLVSPSHPWPPDFIDDDRSAVRGLRERLKADRVVSLFTTVDDFGKLLAAALANLRVNDDNFPKPSKPSLASYAAAMLRRYQRVDLDGLTPPQKEEYLQLLLRSVFIEQDVRENPPPIELPKELWEKLRRQKQILPEDLPSGMSRDKLAVVMQQYLDKPRRPATTIVSKKNNTHTVILGDPGSGKSTLLRYIMLSLLDDRGDPSIKKRFGIRVPFLIEIRSFAAVRSQRRCETFVEYLEYVGRAEGWALPTGHISQLLENGALLLFDGLDEIFDPIDRDAVASQIAATPQMFPNTRVIVTSRQIGYRRRLLSDAGYRHFTIQDLDRNQVDRFVEHWYDLTLGHRPKDTDRLRSRLLEAYDASGSIQQLCGNPMLLTIMAIISRHQELPRERWKLYQHAASVLIQHWDINKHLQQFSTETDFISEEDKHALLRRLAFRMQAGIGGLAGNYIYKDELRSEIQHYFKERYLQTPDRAAKSATSILDQLRSRNFILSLYGADIYGFVHRAFLEYFCASVFVVKFEKERQLDIDSLKREVFGTHWQDQSWHEVLRLICAMLDERFALDVIGFLAGVVGRRNWLKALAEEDELPENIMLAFRCLGELHYAEGRSPISKRLLLTACKIVETCAVIGSDSRATEIVEDVIIPAAQALGTRWYDSRIITSWLKHLRRIEERNFSAETSRFIGAFLAAIGRGERTLRDSLNVLGTSDNWEDRILVPYALALGWQDATAKHQLFTLAKKDSENEVRVAATAAIIAGFPDHPWTLEVMRSCVKDEYYWVRCLAVQTLGRYFFEERGIRDLLARVAVIDKSVDVQDEALNVLEEHLGGAVKNLLESARTEVDREGDPFSGW